MARNVGSHFLTASGLFILIPMIKTTKGSSILAVNLPSTTCAMPPSFLLGRNASRFGFAVRPPQRVQHSAAPGQNLDVPVLGKLPEPPVRLGDRKRRPRRHQ